jgi:hypothetical protein
MRWLWEILDFEKFLDHSWSLHPVDLTGTVTVKLDENTLAVLLACLLGVGVSLGLIALGSTVILVPAVCLFVLLRVGGLVLGLWGMHWAYPPCIGRIHLALGVSTLHWAYPPCIVEDFYTTKKKLFIVKHN